MYLWNRPKRRDERRFNNKWTFIVADTKNKLKPNLDKTLTMKTVITLYDHNRRPNQEQKDTEDSHTQEGNEEVETPGDTNERDATGATETPAVRL